MATISLVPQKHAARWRPVIAAMSKSGGGSILSGLFAVLATKIMAASLGPGYVALLQTLQQTRQVALAAATLNGQTALVQGASSLPAPARREFLRTGSCLLGIATLAVAVGLLASPARTARLCGLPPGSEALVAWLTVPVVLSSIYVFLSALLNALGEIGKLALVQVLASGAMAAAAWPVVLAVRRGHSTALVHMLGFSAAVSVTAAVMMLARHRHVLAVEFLGPARWWTARAVSHFLSISGAMLATSVLFSAALLAFRARISRTQGWESTGQFDAAWGISMNHVTLVLGSLQTYYLPVLARAHSAEERNRHIASVLTVATLVAAPLIVGIAVLKPLVLAWFYSPAFQPAAAYLRWTLVGDYLKVGSWVLSIPLLAAAEMRVFFVADLVAVATFAGSAEVISRVQNAAESAAIAFLLCYVVHFAVCYGYAHRRHGFRLGPRGLAIWTAGLVVVAAVAAKT